MDFTFRSMNLEYLNEINSWNYEGFIEEVLMTPYFDSFNKTGRLIGPGGCEGFAVFSENEIVGLFEYKMAEGALEIGLALKPKLIGTGIGETFVRQGIAFGTQHYNLYDIKLVVDSKNKAAIRVYEKVGFIKVNQMDHEIEMRMTL